MSEIYNLGDGRAYVHKRCGESTIVTGDDFAGLCDPSQVCLGTICANCGGPDSVAAFYWEDTKEPLHDYRKRLRNTAPSIYKTWAVIVPLIGLVGGGIMGAKFLATNLQLDIAIGSAVGIVVMWLIVGPAIAGMFGTNFYEQR